MELRYRTDIRLGHCPDIGAISGLCIPRYRGNIDSDMKPFWIISGPIILPRYRSDIAPISSDHIMSRYRGNEKYFSLPRYRGPNNPISPRYRTDIGAMKNIGVVISPDAGLAGPGSRTRQPDSRGGGMGGVARGPGGQEERGRRPASSARAWQCRSGPGWAGSVQPV